MYIELNAICISDILLSENTNEKKTLLAKSNAIQIKLRSPPRHTHTATICFYSLGFIVQQKARRHKRGVTEKTSSKPALDRESFSSKVKDPRALEFRFFCTRGQAKRDGSLSDPRARARAERIEEAVALFRRK